MGIRSLLGLKREKRKPTATTTQPLYRTYPYLDACGQFDYERYKAAQFAANKRKIENVWAQPEDIEMLSGYIRRHIPNPRFGLCHGTRRGLEQKWFREHLKCEVVGTEISDTAMEFPNTIQWDFHETKPEWLGACDFIYSNSFDHAYDPEKCLNAWGSCLSPHGLLLIEHSLAHIESTETDPFGAPLYTMPYLILIWGKGSYFVSNILDAVPTSRKVRRASKFLVIQRSQGL